MGFGGPMRPIYLQWWRQNPRNDVHFPGAKESSNIQSLSSGFPCWLSASLSNLGRSRKPPAPEGRSPGRKNYGSWEWLWNPWWLKYHISGVSAANRARWISWHLWKLRSQLGWNHQPTYDVSGQHLSTNMVLCKAPSAPISGESNGLSLAVAISGLSASHFFPHWARSIWCILGLSKLDPSPTWNLCKSLHGKISPSVKTSTSPSS